MNKTLIISQSFRKKPVVLRRCIVTRKHYSSDQMIRIGLHKQTVFIDHKNNLNGRGCYILKKLNLQQKKVLFKQRLINKAFKVAVPVTIYDELANLIGVDNEK